jgi:hypothetical protein
MLTDNDMGGFRKRGQLHMVFSILTTKYDPGDSAIGMDMCSTIGSIDLAYLNGYNAQV